MISRPLVLVFDVIETLFTLEPLRAQFQESGQPAGALELWFATALRDMFALAAAGSYTPMLKLLEAALDEIDAIEGGAPDKENVTAAMGSLPPLPDVASGLKSLQHAGFRMVALTNGSASTTKKLLDRADISHMFEKILSTDDVQHAKPHASVYLHAAREMAVEPGEVMLIASHPWDLHGAKTAGLNTAYLNRGKPFPDFMASPDLSEKSLTGLAERLSELEGTKIPNGVDALTS